MRKPASPQAWRIRRPSWGPSRACAPSPTAAAPSSSSAPATISATSSGVRSRSCVPAAAAAGSRSACRRRARPERWSSALSPPARGLGLASCCRGRRHRRHGRRPGRRRAAGRAFFRSDAPAVAASVRGDRVLDRSAQVRHGVAERRRDSLDRRLPGRPAGRRTGRAARPPARRRTRPCRRPGRRARGLARAARARQRRARAGRGCGRRTSSARDRSGPARMPTPCTPAVLPAAAVRSVHATSARPPRTPVPSDP